MLTSENRLDSEYITLKVNNDENKILNKYDETQGIIEANQEAYKIYEGHLRKDQVINFEIRMWMGEEVELSEEVVNKTFKSKVTVEAVVENTAGVYKEDILNGADPVLADNLIPVTIDDKGKVTRADTNKKWYNYANQEWANAVILEDDYEDPGAGKEIPEDQIESYFVWIPKYSYQLWDLGEYDSLTEVDSTKPHTIPIRFGTTNTIDTKGECATPMNSDNTQGLSGESKTCKVGDYMTHPAFISFGVNGLWVGKFETGYKDATNTATAQVNPANEEEAKTNEIVIKSNMYSWRGIQVAKAYLVSYNYKRDLDSHMMKNTEWGAVAYLQHSIYGSRKSSRINNNDAYITGYASTEDATLGTSASSIAGNRFESTNLKEDKQYTVNYFNPASVMASTTNNYTGVYDMSGGAYEYVMGITKNSAVQLGLDLSLYSSKYYDSYSSSSNTDYNKRILGDATGEDGPFQREQDPDKGSRNNSSWYNDLAYFANSSRPCFYRGGYVRYGIHNGIFNFGDSTCAQGTSNSFRIVLALTEE